VEVRFKAPEGDESTGFNIPYLCPNCNRTHYNDLSDYVGNDKPLVMAGYVVGSDRVMVQDLAVRSNFVDSVVIEFGGRRYKAAPVRRYPEQAAVELKAERPIEGVKPLVFTGGNVSAEEAKFFFHAKEDGLFVSGLLSGSALKFRHYAGIGKDLAPMPANVIVLDAKNRPVSLSFTTPVVLGEAGFVAPQTWKGEEPYAFDARLDAMQKKVNASLVPVYVHREEEKRSSGRSRFSFRIRGSDDGKGLDIDVVGFALPNGELLVQLNLDASMTAEIDKLEAVMPDGKRTPLEYVGAFDKYALAVVRFPGGRHPAGIVPMKIYGGKVDDLMLRKLYTLSVRSLDGTLSGELLSTVAENTILKGSLTLEGAEANEKYLTEGAECAKQKGLTAALFKVRVLDKALSGSKNDCYSFLLGAILSDVISATNRREPKRAIIGGRRELREPLAYLLKRYTKTQVTEADEQEAENAAAKGAVRVFERKHAQ